MKNKISSFMDGELEQRDVSNLIEAIKRDDELQQEWKTYHLIGDTLRQSSRLSMNISSRVSQKLKSEPTILSPHLPAGTAKKQKYKVFAFSMAASVVAMVSGWLIMHDLYQPRQIIVAEQSRPDKNLTASPLMVSTPPSPIPNYSYPPVEMNDYLFVHREFSPGITMRGQVTNINSVNDYHERYGR